jgi:hypothetical protein
MSSDSLTWWYIYFRAWKNYEYTIYIVILLFKKLLNHNAKYVSNLPRSTTSMYIHVWSLYNNSPRNWDCINIKHKSKLHTHLDQPNRTRSTTTVNFISHIFSLFPYFRSCRSVVRYLIVSDESDTERIQYSLI